MKIFNKCIKRASTALKKNIRMKSCGYFKKCSDY